jgi:HEAT repeat protein
MRLMGLFDRLFRAEASEQSVDERLNQSVDELLDRERERQVADLAQTSDVKQLIRTLADRNYHTQGLASDALDLLGVDRTVEPLIDVLEDDTETEEVRTAAARQLGRLGDRRAVERLIPHLHHDSPGVRQRAALVLGRLGDLRAMEPLTAALADATDGVRAAAADSLGKLGDRRGVEPLIAALGDGSADVRKEAAWGLGALADQDDRARYALIAALPTEAGSTAASALGRLGDRRAVEPLIAALKSADREVRLSAASSLGEIGDTRAVEPLIAALLDETETVRRVAVMELGALGDRRAEGPLLALLRHPMVQPESIDSLTGTKPEIVEALRKIAPDAAERVMLEEAAISGDREERGAATLTLWAQDDATANKLATDRFYLFGVLKADPSPETEAFLEAMDSGALSHAITPNPAKGGFDVELTVR